MHIYIIRHGESMATLDPTLFSRTDPRKVPLTQWGYEQAVETGQHISELYSNNAHSRKLKVYCAPHDRIVQSKDGFLQGMDAKVISSVTVDSLLREREHGDFDGLTRDQQYELRPDIVSKLESTNSEERYATRMPNGESLKDVHDRMKEFLQKLRSDVSPNEDVVIITHGGNCRALEDNLIHHEASWIGDYKQVPGTGDIIGVQTDLIEPGVSETIHQGKKRPLNLPRGYKTEPYGLADQARQLSSL